MFKIKKRYTIGILIVILFLAVELKPQEIYSSSIFTSSNSIDIRLHVLVNSLLPVDKKELAKEIVASNQKINGRKEQAEYELILYRTKIHYNQNKEFDVLLCDENGNILE